MEDLNGRSEIKALIKTVSEENGINNHIITDVIRNQKGEGYLGEVFMVTVQDSISGKQQQMVIKAAFTDKKAREFIPIRISFQNEIFFYKNLYKTYKHLEKENGISLVEYVPKCLKVSLKEQEEILILENLKESGFEIFDKKLILDDNHIKLIFETYGRFHGYSYVLKDQKPEEYAQITKQFPNVYNELLKITGYGDYLGQLAQSVANFLIPGEDDEIIKKFTKYSEGTNVANIFKEIVTNECEYSAILHGDCWSNNMMFKYEDTASSRKPTQMRLIDFQLLRVGSPVDDLSYCLYSGASKKVFDHLNEHLESYYKSFSSIVKQLGSDPDEIFPFQVLKEQWRKHSRFGMIMTLQILKMKLTDQEDVLDLTDAANMELEDLKNTVSKQKFDQEVYSKRIKELLWHMHEIDAL